MSNTASTANATCFCVGKAPDCTCGGRCRCACTCWKDKKEITTFQDWMYQIDNPDLISEGGQQEIHKTKGGKGAVGQAIAKDKLRKLPPNCS